MTEKWCNRQRSIDSNSQIRNTGDKWNKPRLTSNLRLRYISWTCATTYFASFSFYDRIDIFFFIKVWIHALVVFSTSCISYVVILCKFIINLSKNISVKIASIIPIVELIDRLSFRRHPDETYLGLPSMKKCVHNDQRLAVSTRRYGVYDWCNVTTHSWSASQRSGYSVMQIGIMNIDTSTAYGAAFSNYETVFSFERNHSF